MDQAYLHPSDKAALAVLQKVPGFQTATKWVMKLGVEEYCRAQYMANHIRLSERQLPKIYNLLPPICKRLKIEVPEFYLQMYPTPNATTVGDKRNYIVITSGLLDCLDEDELKVALAHECGHIACRHVYYSTMVQMMLNLGATVPVLRDIQDPLMLAYTAWCRASEHSADRASAVVEGSIVPVVRTLLRLGAGPSRFTADLDIAEYLDQVTEAEGLRKGTRWQSVLKDYSELGEDHPYLASRVRDLVLWSRGSGQSMLVTK